MNPHRFSFNWQGKEYHATFHKIGGNAPFPVFIPVYDVEPTDILPDGIQYQLEDKGFNLNYPNPDNKPPYELLDIIFRAIQKEAERIGLDLYDPKTY